MVIRPIGCIILFAFFCVQFLSLFHILNYIESLLLIILYHILSLFVLSSLAAPNVPMSQLVVSEFRRLVNISDVLSLMNGPEYPA